MRGSSGRIPVGLVATGSMVALGLAAGRFPLLELPGFELAALGVLGVAVLGAPLGISAARRELARIQPSVLRAYFRAASVIAALPVILFVISAIRGVLISRCSVSAGLVFLPVLALPAALLAAALGVFAGIAARGHRLVAVLWYTTVALVSLAWSLRSAYYGPSAYFLDHLFGYWPGPLYDEAVVVDERLVLFQLGTLAWAATLVAASALLPAIRPRLSDTLSVHGHWLPPTAALLLAFSAVAAVRVIMGARGDLASHQSIASTLGASRQGALCRIVFPSEKRPEDAERLERSCELDAALVASALQIDRPPLVVVYFYRSEAERRRLVGAGQTNYTKPWLVEVHLVDAPLPHPVLRHELVHAFASAFANGPLRVPARWGVLVSPGLVEGLAVAIELPLGDWTAHEWTRAMRDLGLMPKIASIIGPIGFFGAPPARAYTVAGSFLAFLLERYSAAPVKRVYGGVEFTEAFGKPFDVLVAEWSSFLDGVEVPAALRTAAAARFHGESLFVRTCAREVAQLESRARILGQSGRLQEAAVLWRKAADLSGDPNLLRAAGEALARTGDLEATERTYRDALQRVGVRRSLQGSLEAALGDLCWRRGDLTGALERYHAAQKLDPDPAEARLLAAKIAACEDPALSEEVGPWLLQLGDPAVNLARMAQSKAPLAEYLMGRAFLGRGAPRLAVRPLSRAAKLSGLLGESFKLETRRLLAEAQCAAGDWDHAIAGFTALAHEAPTRAPQLRAADAASRCELERELFRTPVAMPGDRLE